MFLFLACPGDFICVSPLSSTQNLKILWLERSLKTSLIGFQIKSNLNTMISFRFYHEWDILHFKNQT